MADEFCKGCNRKIVVWKMDWCMYCGHLRKSGVAAPKVARYPDPSIESTESVELEEIESEEQDPFTARRILLFVWRVVCALLCGAIGAVLGAAMDVTGMVPVLAVLGLVAGYLYGSIALLFAFGMLLVSASGGDLSHISSDGGRKRRREE